MVRQPPGDEVALGPRRARFDGFDLHAIAVPARACARDGPGRAPPDEEPTFDIGA